MGGKASDFNQKLTYPARLKLLYGEGNYTFSTENQDNLYIVKVRINLEGGIE